MSLHLEQESVSHLDGKYESKRYKGSLPPTELLKGHGLASTSERDADLEV